MGTSAVFEGHMHPRRIRLGQVALAMFAAVFLVFIFFPVSGTSKRVSIASARLVKLKQLAISAAMYQEDADGRYMPASTWCDSLLPYVGSEEVFEYPGDSDRYRYAMNRALDRADIPILSELDPPTVLFFESTIAKRNAVGGLDDLLVVDGTTTVALCNGSAKNVTENTLHMYVRPDAWVRPSYPRVDWRWAAFAP